MIQSFLDGYNVTIIAYGQTGSGKTFTMGSDAQDSSSGNDTRGFIPRFMEEVFARVNAPPPPSATSTSGPVDESTAVPVHETVGDEAAPVDLGNVVDAPSTTVSFLEIYGEDIYDLLQEPEILLPGTAVSRDGGHHQSKSLALREENGSVSVVGLTEVTIADGAEAMEQLSRGTQHRTTASTLMNTVSSRSHAVFALTLHQKLFGEGYGPDGQEVVSRLSFVDLAGSERLKRTGAEGQRMKEGIQINKGLLALGNVINALADEEHQKAGQEKHVGYRESKLTRLLQDALGGNSQTLFLACISPAEVNISETLSTLRYANRARNIQNKPVKNTDPLQEELRRLHECTKVLRLECVKERFGVGAPGGRSADAAGAGDDADSAKEEPMNEDQLEELLARQDVKSYLEDLNRRLNVTAGAAADAASLLAKRGPAAASASLFAVPHGVGAPTPLLTASNTLKSRRQSIVNLRRQSLAPGLLPLPGTPGGFLSPLAQGSAGRGVDVSSSVHETSVVEDSLAALGSGDEETLDPENDMRMINKLLDMVKKDEEFEKNEKEHQESIGNMDHQIEEQEQILGQLKKNISQYQVLLEENDLLMRELHSLEGEKAQLVHQLTQQEKENAKTGGGSAAFVNKLKEKLKGVEARLRTQSLEQKKREDAMKLIKRDSQRCRELESNISELKRTKVEMVRKQKDASARFKGYMDQKNRELNEARKSRRREKLEASKLQNENRKLQTAYTRKVKAHQKTEEALRRNKAHLMKLLAMRKRERQRKSTCQRVYRSRSSILAKQGSRAVAMGPREANSADTNTPPLKLWAPEDQALQSAKFCLMQMVGNRAQKQQQKEREQQLQSEYDLLQKQVYDEVGHLNSLKEEFENDAEGDESTANGAVPNLEGRTTEIIEHEERLEELVVKLDLVGGALSEIHLPAYAATESPGGTETGSVRDTDEEDPEALEMDMLSQLDAPALRTLLWSVLDDHSEQEFQHRLLADTMRRKEAELKASELKSEKIEKNNKELRRGFHERMSIMHSERIEFAQAVCSPSGKARRPGKGNRAIAGMRSPAPAPQPGVEETKELEALRAMNTDLESKFDAERAMSTALKEELSELQICNLDVSEKLSLATSTLEQQSETGRAEILSQLEAIQTVWANLGTPAETRSALLTRIETAPASTAQAILDETRSGHESMLTDIQGLQTELRLLQIVAGVTAPGVNDGEIESFLEARAGEASRVHLTRLREARHAMEPRLEDLRTKVAAVQKKAASFTAKVEKYEAFDDGSQAPSSLSSLLALDVPTMFSTHAMEDLLRKEGVPDESIAAAMEQERNTPRSEIDVEDGVVGVAEEPGAAASDEQQEGKKSTSLDMAALPALLSRCMDMWSAAVRDLAVGLAQLQTRYQDTVVETRSQLGAMGIRNYASLVAHLWTPDERSDNPVDTRSETFVSVCRHLLVPDAEAASEARAHEADADFLKCLVGVAAATARAHGALHQVSSLANSFLEEFFVLIFDRLRNDYAEACDELSLPRIGKLLGEVDSCLLKSRHNVSAAVCKLHAMWEAEKTPEDARVTIPPAYEMPPAQESELQLSEVSMILLGNEPIDRRRLVGDESRDNTVMKLLERARDEARFIEAQMTSTTQGVLKVEEKISERGNIVRLDHDLNRLYAESSEFEEKNKDPSRLQDRTGKGRKALLHEESQRQLFQKSIRKTLVELQRALSKWEADHGEKFDANLLSEHGLEVRDDKSKAAIKDKTQLMHLESNMHIQAVNQRRESMEQQYNRRTSIPPRSVARTPSPHLEVIDDSSSELSTRSRSSDAPSAPLSESSSASAAPSVVTVPAKAEAPVVIPMSATTPSPPCHRSASEATSAELATKPATKASGKTNPFLKMVNSRRANSGALPMAMKGSALKSDASACDPSTEQQENIAPPR
jgi:hypothetical protein